MSFFKGIWLLTAKEIKDSFLSPLVYILSALFCLLMGWLFFNYLIASKEFTEQTLTQSVLLPIFGNMNFIFLFLAPLLTMRTFAEEKKLKTIELLLTSRLSHAQIIISKILGTFAMAVFMISLTFIFPVILAMSGYEHWNIVFSSYGGIFLSVLCYIAVGCFASSLTENLVIAALMGFTILLGIMLFSLTGNATQNVLLGQIFQYFAVPYHFDSFIKGGIRSFNLIYLFSFIGFFGFLTHISLESRRW